MKLAATTLAIVAALALAPALCAQSPRSLVNDGNKSYERKQFGEAMSSYQAAEEQKPDSPEIWFNKGDALYQQGKYADAIKAYEQAAVLSDDRKLSALSKYNQGNAAFRQGMESAQSNPQEAIKGLERSVELYRDSLRGDSGIDDSRHNIEVARRAIEQLRVMQQQQQQQQQNQDQDQDQQEQEQQQQQQQQQSGDEQQDEQEQNQQGQQEQQQQQDQQQQQQSQQQQEQEGEQQQISEQAQDILDEERENRRQRRLRVNAGNRPVEKDW